MTIETLKIQLEAAEEIMERAERDLQRAQARWFAASDDVRELRDKLYDAKPVLLVGGPHDGRIIDPPKYDGILLKPLLEPHLTYKRGDETDEYRIFEFVEDES